ncbi:MAG: AAA family ATPase [Saprospiraceae bacterium]|nr:AAA family ATPase [Saprospiraceae bacterium]
MKINSIHIKNFKGIDDKDFYLNSQFTVFIGDNATGKTSILDALAICLGSFFIEMGIGVNTRTIQDHEVRTINTNGQARPQLPVSITAKGIVNDQKIQWKREIIKQKTTSKDAKTISQLAQKLMQESRKGNNVIFPVLAFHGTGRLWAEHEKVGFQKQEEGIKMAYNNCLSAKSSSREFLEWYKTQEDTIAKFDQHLDKAHLTAFKNIILSLVPDERWQDMAFDRKQEELVGIFTDTAGKKHRLAYRQLSDGFRNIIGLAADIAYRCIQLNPHLGENAVAETPGLVLIDELDLHLHPNWQRHIVADLKRAFPKIQFVATTHSPFIVQSLAKDELINLDPNNEGVENNPFDYGIEDVAEIEMGVEDVARSEEFKKRVELASQYYSLIAQGKTSETNHQVAELRRQLNELEDRFSDDATFVATLKLEREAAKL